MAMTHNSFEDIAIHLVAESRSRAQFQVRDIGERLAASTMHVIEGPSRVKRYTEQEIKQAMLARNALIRELLK